MAAHWPDGVDSILDGDHVVMLAYATPARGAVLVPLTNFGIRDRERGTITATNSSVAAWKKLDRIRRDPHVALAYHARDHSSSDRGEFVLVHGKAALSPPIADYPSTILDHWERFEPWRELHPLWKRWKRIYALRVAIEVSVERIVVWPDLACRGAPAVYGVALPAKPPAPQRPPAGGTAPRIDHRCASRSAARLPHVLLGWIGADRFPMVTPVSVAGASEHGILLEPPPGIVPPGGRRAGLTAHSFSRRVIGQHQRKHTGWLEAASAQRLVYAPHTRSDYRFPASQTLFHVVSGGATRLRLRQARRYGAFTSTLPSRTRTS